MPQKKVAKQISTLYDAKARIRLNAVVALMEMGQEAAPAAPFLVGILHDDEEVEIELSRSSGGIRASVRATGTPGRSAVSALVAIGSASVEPLVAGLENEAPLARERSANALNTLNDRRALPSLIGLLRRSEEGSPVQKAAVDALQSISGQKLGADVGRWDAWATDNLRAPH